MKAVKVKPNQTVYDIVVEQYGTCEALAEFLGNNPALENDPVSVGRQVPEAVQVFRLDLPVRSGSVVWIDTDSKLIKTSVIKEIDTEVTTYTD
ncbi:MAG: hypothetical protein NC410_10565 [Oscillibacter sp.]|nr:hypothetical protein [Oscillibacter sp.]